MFLPLLCFFKLFYYVIPSFTLKNEGVTTPWLLPYPVNLQVNKSRPPPRPHLCPALTKHRRQSPAVCVFKRGLGSAH